LAVGVVDDDDQLPGLDVLDGLLDGIEHVRTLLVLAHRDIIRSTYLAMRSTSRLTASPSAARPSVVISSVCGTTATSNRGPSSAATVRLTPSTATDPFSTRYRARSPGASIAMSADEPLRLRSTTLPMPS